MTDMSIKSLCFDESHPALAGHFPGNPIVPGALVLLRLQALAEEATEGSRLLRVDAAKFLSPVSPDEVLDVHFAVGKKQAALELTTLKLTVMRDEEAVCEASFTLQRREIQSQ